MHCSLMTSALRTLAENLRIAKKFMESIPRDLTTIVSSQGVVVPRGEGSDHSVIVRRPARLVIGVLAFFTFMLVIGRSCDSAAEPLPGSRSDELALVMSEPSANGLLSMPEIR